MHDAQPALDGRLHPRPCDRAEHVEPAVKTRVEEWPLLLDERARAPGEPTCGEPRPGPLDTRGPAGARVPFRPITPRPACCTARGMRAAGPQGKLLVSEHATQTRAGRAPLAAVKSIRGARGCRRPLRVAPQCSTTTREFPAWRARTCRRARKERVRDSNVELSAARVRFAELHLIRRTRPSRRRITAEQIAVLPTSVAAAAREQALARLSSAAAWTLSFTRTTPAVDSCRSSRSFPTRACAGDCTRRNGHAGASPRRTTTRR